MKKIIIGAIVGGLIIFLWQFLSFAAINFHRPAQGHTEKQDAIMNFLNSQGLKEGGYIMPTVADDASSDEMKKQMNDSDGKPWASIQYHNEAQNSMSDMMMNMVRGFLVNIAIVFLFCWLVGRMNVPAFSTIVKSALVIGLIVFLNAPYTGSIWYKSFDVWAHLLDAVVSWGLTGLWLAWWLRKGRDNEEII